MKTSGSTSNFPRKLPPHLTNPDVIERALCELSLIDFIRRGWQYMNPARFVDGWHIEAITDHLEAVTRGDIRNLLINIPPRHMKSLAVAVAWPAWTWAQSKKGPLAGPQVQFLAASYAADLAIRDNVKCRRLIQSQWYQRLWGDRFAFRGDVNRVTRFENTESGHRLATSVGGQLTGEGGDVILIDDPHNVLAADHEKQRTEVLEWWDEALPTRLNDPKTGAFVVIMQRVHEADLAGHILEQGGFEHLCLPAEYEPERRCHTVIWDGDERTVDGDPLWPERFGKRELAVLKKRLGAYAAAGQLQQSPAPREGGMFKKTWFEIVEAAPSGAKRVRFWDLASTEVKPGTDPDWTAGPLVSLKDGVYYIEHMERFRGSPRTVEDTVKLTAQLDGRGVAIGMEEEGGSSGKNNSHHYATRVLVGYAFKPRRATGPKEERARVWSTAAERGDVKLVRGPWNAAFLDEIAVFPLGKHDDQVDGVSGAVEQLAEMAGDPDNVTIASDTRSSPWR